MKMQEPKYDFQGGKVINRASGKAIPDDEPVMVFRARDFHASPMIKYYADLVKDPMHKGVVMDRYHDFEMFRLKRHYVGNAPSD
ncbi:MAG: hypothetical protein AAFW97_07810 [Pseudomonadota bacterium]